MPAVTAGLNWRRCNRGNTYINIALFRVTLAPIAEVAPGYVAVIRSNVGAELEKSTVHPNAMEESAGLKGPVHEEVEKLLYYQ